MADQTEETVVPDPRDIRIQDLEAQVKSLQAEVPDPRDIRIQDLEAQVKSLQAEVNELNEHTDEISSGYESQIGKLKSALSQAQSSGGTPADGVYIDGVQHVVIGTFRADNTFVPVKQGFCPEGVTLIAVDKAH